MNSKPKESTEVIQSLDIRVTVGLILFLLVVFTCGTYDFIEKTPHCNFEGGGYYCDMFASSTEKQKMCVMDSLMNTPTTGYNADTGKTFTLSDSDRKAMYDFIVESCKT